MDDDLKLCVEILDKAIVFEQEGIRFFGERAQQAPSNLERRLFESLVRDEIGHREYLMRLRVDLLRSRDLQSLAGAQDGQRHRPPREIFESALAGAQDHDEYEPAELELLRGAMDVERRGYTLYSDAARRVASPAARDLFLHLAGEEQNHYRLLSNTHDYLEDPEAWHGFDESPMLDGG